MCAWLCTGWLGLANPSLRLLLFLNVYVYIIYVSVSQCLDIYIPKSYSKCGWACVEEERVTDTRQKLLRVGEPFLLCLIPFPPPLIYTYTCTQTHPPTTIAPLSHAQYLATHDFVHVVSCRWQGQEAAPLSPPHKHKHHHLLSSSP